MNEQALTKLLTPEETSEILGIKTETLAVWRCTGRHDLPFVKVGRLVRYRSNDVEQFIDNDKAKEQVLENIDNLLPHPETNKLLRAVKEKLLENDIVLDTNPDINEQSMINIILEEYDFDDILLSLDGAVFTHKDGNELKSLADIFYKPPFACNLQIALEFSAI